ncbi:uncharacterized protein LOC21404784 [Morus notabilis]|uniref:uncharacterized protein LOC21404784 n=1 Tax=Morus notabilis TaxID=981085 RepID=UPI000CED2E12|nr:uncharacterized protein LOC21404784 [Morus notabilis]
MIAFIYLVARMVIGKTAARPLYSYLIPLVLLLVIGWPCHFVLELTLFHNPTRFLLKLKSKIFSLEKSTDTSLLWPFRLFIVESRRLIFHVFKDSERTRFN